MSIVVIFSSFIWFLSSGRSIQQVACLFIIFPVFCLHLYSVWDPHTLATFQRKYSPLLIGILERIHKLNYLSSVESSAEIVFPRVKRRLLHLKDESQETFKVPEISEVERCILTAKIAAVKRSKDCGMNLSLYGDNDLLFPGNDIINAASKNDYEEEPIEEPTETEQDNGLTVHAAISINEDICLIRDSSQFPIYRQLAESSSTSRRYSLLNKNGKTSFVEYNGAYIRKSTALYLLQEKKQISNDRLLRVRSSQPSHLFNDDNYQISGPQTKVNSGDLCIFKRLDLNKNLIGRVIQFSYLEGTKKQRQYSSSYVDMALESHKEIGVFANWYGVSTFDLKSGKVYFRLTNAFTAGYLSMANYLATITADKTESTESEEDAAFAISVTTIEELINDWRNTMTFNSDFSE